ncbi:uncharacterized protein LOC126195304 [Schistocerca nitens]|uniref:uncharacterized protein LOC126195304 n=1 Tax=Schistocerca nitens TaxID=7011 RepID=UPI002118C6A9|nr:uncharacterized protein LOC126195304 [Schistocerca nitens]
MQPHRALLLVAGLVLLTPPAQVSADYRPNPRPDPLTDCCVQGVPVCARLSRELGIPDFGCEVLCRSQGFPGSLGCEYSGPTPACGCANQPVVEAPDPQTI